MKCSSRKAPMGTTPLMECRRRRRNEVPSPARSGATPDLICGATELAADATMTAPYVIQMCKLVIIGLRWKRSQGEMWGWKADGETASEGGRKNQNKLPGSISAGLARGPSIAESFGRRLHDGCDGIFLRGPIGRRSCELRERRTVDRIQIHPCLGARPE